MHDDYHEQEIPLAFVSGGSMSLRKVPANTVQPAFWHRMSDKLLFVCSGKGALWLFDPRCAHEEMVTLRHGVSIAIPAGLQYQLKVDDEAICLAVTSLPCVLDDERAIEGKWQLVGDNSIVEKISALPNRTGEMPLTVSRSSSGPPARFSSMRVSSVVSIDRMIEYYDAHLKFTRVWVNIRGSLIFGNGAYRAFFSKGQISNTSGWRAILDGKGRAPNLCNNSSPCKYGEECQFVHLCIENGPPEFWWKHNNALLCSDETCKFNPCGLKHKREDLAPYSDSLRCHLFEPLVVLCGDRYGLQDSSLIPNIPLPVQQVKQFAALREKTKIPLFTCV